MGKEFLKFGEVEIEKQEFHSSKSAITINNIHSPQKVANVQKMQCPKNSTCNLATSTKVKLFKLFKFNLLTTAILSKMHTLHPTCPSDTGTSLHKM